MNYVLLDTNIIINMVVDRRNQINLDYSWQRHESGWKPHNYYILTKYCFHVLSEEKRASICGKIKVLKLNKITQRSPLWVL